MGGEIRVSHTAAITKAICFRTKAGDVAACGASWLSSLWSSQWPFVDCRRCLERAPAVDSQPAAQPPAG